MKELLNKVKDSFFQKGYRKRGNSFWKIENGFYRLVNFQKGAYGNYYFISLGLHPLNFPRIEKSEVRICEHPKEWECIIRERAEHAVSSPALDGFREGFVFTSDEKMISNICSSVDDFEMWFDEWGSFEKISNASFDEIIKLFGAVPLLLKKYYLMLKCYCAFKAGLKEKSEELLEDCIKETVEDMDFSAADEYLSKTVNNCQ